MARLLILAVVGWGVLANSAPAQAQASLAKPKKGLSLQNVAQKQRSPARAELDAAIVRLKNGEFAAAATAFHGYLGKHRVLRDRARYHLAKSLYRLGAYRSALFYFGGLLTKGPKNRYYNASLEWCLFISRKMQDDGAVNEVVARFGGETFPAAYRDEFLFRLARFHFSRALAIERGRSRAKRRLLALRIARPAASPSRAIRSATCSKSPSRRGRKRVARPKREAVDLVGRRPFWRSGRQQEGRTGEG